MTPESTPAYRFGDLLALARLSWVRQMSTGLAAVGYDDYRRSDAAVMRLLQRGPVSIGRLGETTSVTRQAARKIVDSLERRGFATASRDAADSRQINVRLTSAGASYASAVVAVIERLNRELCERVDPTDLAAADRVLRAVVAHVPGLQPAQRRGFKPTLTGVVPILFVRNVEDAAAWYERLGFGTDFLHGKPPFCGSVSRDEVCLHLRLVGKPNFAELADREASLILAGIEVNDVEAIFDEIDAAAPDAIVQRLAHQDWGGLDFHVRDPDGNRISFVQYSSSSSTPRPRGAVTRST